LSNKKVYESEEVVAYYRSYNELQKPEETILRLLQPVLAIGRVLDIGVGGGRTTRFLSAAAREYVGIDYSAKMVAVCQKRFRRTSHVQFLVCDARDMRIFVDHSFDVVVFSFNGLDYVGHDDRLRVLREVRRVLRSGGWFIFSSHNLLGALRLFRYFAIWPPLWPPWKWVLAPAINAKRRALNPNWFELLNQPYAILNDGAHDWRLHTYYVDPRFQVKQLHDAGFASVRFFSLKSGTEIGSAEQLESNRDPWLFFLCKAKM
jgi:SAM-dependent methyltransferase